MTKSEKVKLLITEVRQRLTDEDITVSELQANLLVAQSLAEVHGKEFHLTISELKSAPEPTKVMIRKRQREAMHQFTERDIEVQALTDVIASALEVVPKASAPPEPIDVKCLSTEQFFTLLFDTTHPDEKKKLITARLYYLKSIASAEKPPPHITKADYSMLFEVTTTRYSTGELERKGKTYNELIQVIENKPVFIQYREAA